MGEQVIDVAIVGCGPAGLSAAINVRNRERSVNLHGVEFCTKKLHRSPEIRNYLGFPNITGPELREAFFGHLKTAGVEVLKGKITSIMPMGDQFILATAHDTFTARAVILASGVAPAKYLPGEKELLGRGVSYCATCDGALFRGRNVAVVGQGSEAKEETAFLAELCAKVYWFGKPEEAPELANVTVARPVLDAIEGQGKVERVVAGGESYPVDGVFILRELTSAESLLPGLEMAEGAIKVDRQMATNLPGVFAAGDCTGRPYQLAKAVGEGLMAALSAVHYVDQRRAAQEKG